MIAAVASGFTRCLCKPNRGATTADDQLKELGKMKKILDAQIVRAKSTMDTNEAEERESQGDTKKWLDDVNNILYKKEAIDKEIRKAEKGLRRLLPDCCLHSNLGRRISRLMEEMITLSEAGRQLSGESLSLPVSKIGMELLEKKIVGETTAMKTLEIVWGLVMDDKIRGIGLYGMGGVGKTAIMKVINNRLLNEQERFSKVIWVTVSRNMDISRLQDVIAKELGTGLNEVGRSSELCEKLGTVGGIVLILDDMWEVFPLHQIGIPDFSGDSGSKIVLTSRSLEVCQMMGCAENIPVQRLSEEEAWELFSETLGSNQLDEKVESIARNVAKECSGLPLAILTIASAMRGHETEGDWRIALRDLQESTKWIVNMEDKVIARLEFSYNNLRSDEAKNCFLYFSMYPEDYVVNSEELIDNWVMDGLLSGVGIEEKLNQGRNVLNDLKKCCLIEDNSTAYLFEGFLLGNVQMHDLIRDMALHITKKNPRFMVKAGTRVGKLGDEILWEDGCEKVSFIQCYLTEILVCPSCPRVRTLLLHENTSLHQISDGFFLKMRSLTILNLSGIGIELLPESISDLVNLHVLDLSGCRKLKKLHSVKKLQSLKALRLSSCPIEELPDGMEKLVNLERLNLSDTKLKAFPTTTKGNLYSIG